MLSVGAIGFEDRFCASKKGGIGGGGRVSARGAVHMAAALYGSYKVSVASEGLLENETQCIMGGKRAEILAWKLRGKWQS